MKRVHFTAQYLLAPQHPVTVNVIGAGGTGSQVVTNLARMDKALKGLGHPGLSVCVYDPDSVSPTNLGRQLFCESDLGQNKAQCLVTRINRYFGNDWMAVPELFPTKQINMESRDFANITITCTDNINSRLKLASVLSAICPKNYDDYLTPLYWMDFGNAQSTGQVIIGTVFRKIKQPNSEKFQTIDRMKVITEYVKYSGINESESGPSCSLAEALEKQDLFVNSTLAQLGCDILWKMFREGMIAYQGVFMNLDTMKVNPVYI